MGVAFQHGGPPCKVCHQSPHLKKALAPADYASIMQVEEEDGLVCVLLDEVESLTRARSAAVSGSEPADAIRAVNALLTQVLSLQDPVVASALTLPGCMGTSAYSLACFLHALTDVGSAGQLDALKAHPNVLVLTTSNITGAIDLAFVDRADIKAYVGPPGIQVDSSVCPRAA